MYMYMYVCIYVYMQMYIYIIDTNNETSAMFAGYATTLMTCIQLRVLGYIAL
jgi:hypothetical protein